MCIGVVCIYGKIELLHPQTLFFILKIGLFPFACLLQTSVHDECNYLLEFALVEPASMITAIIQNNSRTM